MRLLTALLLQWVQQKGWTRVKEKPLSRKTATHARDEGPSAGAFRFSDDERSVLLTALDGRAALVEQLEAWIQSRRPARIPAGDEPIGGLSPASETGRILKTHGAWTKKRRLIRLRHCEHIKRLGKATKKLRDQLDGLETGAREILAEPWSLDDVPVDLSLLRNLPPGWLDEAQSRIERLYAATIVIEKAFEEARPKPGKPRTWHDAFRLLEGVRLARMLKGAGVEISATPELVLSTVLRTCLQAQGYDYPQNDDSRVLESVLEGLNKTRT